MTGTEAQPVTLFESPGAAAAKLRSWAGLLSPRLSPDLISERETRALVADLRGAVATLTESFDLEPPDEGMTPLRAAQAAVVRVLRRSGVEYPDLDTLALRAARVVLDPGAPAGSVVAGMQSAYSDGIRATANYVRQHGSPGEGISAAEAERLWGGLAAMETRAEALANRKR
jgi:hypothetical protein